MDLHNYFKQSNALTVEQLAAAIGVKHAMTVRSWQHGYANRKPSPKYCVRIEEATGGLVTRKDLRPDDYAEIWTELAGEVA
ncbi:transcriptional regulator [Saezia sanguinis]|uniref:transcriptional regulator n=1 Tax=Saezia sanguinis TaxID=1965230 RepID=UPI0030D915AA